MLGLNGVVDRKSAQETFQWLMDNSEFIAVVSKDTGRAVGHVCIHPPIEKVEDDPKFKSRKGASLSFAIAKWERRKGLMLEALQKLIGAMFSSWIVDYFDCEYPSFNAASRELQKRLGFKFWSTEKFGDVEIIINILQNPG